MAVGREKAAVLRPFIVSALLGQRLPFSAAALNISFDFSFTLNIVYAKYCLNGSIAMRKFTWFTLMLAMLMLVSSGVYAAAGDPRTIEGGTGTNSTVAGVANTASGEHGSAFGFQNKADAIDGTAIGSKNTVTGVCGSAFGSYNAAANTWSTAIGNYNNWDYENNSPLSECGVSSTAIGTNNQALGNNSSAIGYYNATYDSEALAVGSNNMAAKNAAAVGYWNAAFGNNSTSLGYSNNIGLDSTLMPDLSLAYTSGANSTAVGYNNTATGTNSVAMGYKNFSDGSNSTAVGNANKAFGLKDSALGIANTTSGEGSSAVGYSNIASDNYSNAFGRLNEASGEGSSAFGYSNTASKYANAFGRLNEASGEGSSAFGYNNITSAASSSAFGYKNNVSNEKSVAVGYNNIVSGFNSSVFGNSSIAIGDRSTAIGYQAVSKESNTVSFGHSSGDSDVSGGTYDDDLNSRLVHVAAGTEDTDAVNVAQLNTAIADKQTSLGETQLAAVNSGITSSKVAAYDIVAASGITADKVDSYDAFISIVTPVTGGAFRISNVADAVDDGDAVNYGQVKNSFVNASFDSTTRKLTLTNVNGSTVDVEIPGGSGSGSDPELESKVTQNTTDIATNKTAIAQNTTDIATNKTNIAKNSSEIENIRKTQEGLGIASSKKNDNTFSDGSIAIGSKNESGKEAKVSMAIGSDNVVVGKNSIAIGYAIKGKNNDFIGNTVKGDYSIAVGYGHTITGNNSGAFGDPSDISGHGSYAMGNDNKITGNGSFIVGNNGNVSGANSVAIGNQSVATADNVVSFGHSAGDEKGQEGGTYEEDLNRRLIHVADAQDDNDAVNYGQMKDYVAANAGNSGEVIKLRNDLNKMDGRISKVGASAGALAALKPMEFDPDNKWSAGVGFGNLNGKNAAAVGLFYRPNRDVYYSLGGNVGGEENIVNAGINFSFGHRSEKPVEARHYTVVHDNAVGVSNVNTVDAAEFDVFCQENAELKDKVAAQDAEIISQKNEISDLKYRIKHLERLMLKMSKK